MRLAQWVDPAAQDADGQGQVQELLADAQTTEDPERSEQRGAEVARGTSSTSSTGSSPTATSASAYFRRQGDGGDGRAEALLTPCA